MAAAKDIATFLASERAEAESAVQGGNSSAALPTVASFSQAAAGWLTNATPEALARFQSLFSVWSGTTGPGDILYTPSGFVVAHRAHNDRDIFGVKVGLLVPNDLSSLPFAVEGMATAGKNSTSTVQALDFIKRVLKWQPMVAQGEKAPSEKVGSASAGAGEGRQGDSVDNTDEKEREAATPVDNRAGATLEAAAAEMPKSEEAVALEEAVADGSAAEEAAKDAAAVEAVDT